MCKCVILIRHLVSLLSVKIVRAKQFYIKQYIWFFLSLSGLGGGIIKIQVALVAKAVFCLDILNINHFNFVNVNYLDKEDTSIPLKPIYQLRNTICKFQSLYSASLIGFGNDCFRTYWKVNLCVHMWKFFIGFGLWHFGRRHIGFGLPSLSPSKSDFRKKTCNLPNPIWKF